MKKGYSSDVAGFTCNMSIRIGDGSKVPFWNSIWLGQSPLFCVYPNIFQEVENGDNIVQEMGCWVNYKLQWRIVDCESNLNQEAREE